MYYNSIEFLYYYESNDYEIYKLTSYYLYIKLIMSNCGTPLCLSPKDGKRNNVLLRVPEEMINYAPLESMKIPKNNKIR